MDDNTKNLIQNHIDSNEVCLFMKGTPDAPQCGFLDGSIKHVKNSRS
jgi:monothiol glutaredoxin